MANAVEAVRHFDMSVWIEVEGALVSFVKDVIREDGEIENGGSDGYDEGEVDVVTRTWTRVVRCCVAPVLGDDVDAEGESE